MTDHNRSSELSSRLIERLTTPHQELISRSQMKSAKLALREALSKFKSTHNVKLWQVAIERLEALSYASTLRVALEELQTAKTVRLVTQSTMQRAWTRGVCYRLIDCPEVTGYSTLLSRLSYLSSEALETLTPRLEARGLLGSFIKGLDAQKWTADCYDLAMNADVRGLMVIHQVLSRRSEDQGFEVQSLIQSALWLSALIHPQERALYDSALFSPPNSLITLEILTCNWLRGVRRSASRSHGRETARLVQRKKKLSFPYCLGVSNLSKGDQELSEKVNESLAPLRLEWLSTCAYSLTAHHHPTPSGLPFSEVLRELLGAAKWNELRHLIAQTLPKTRSELLSWFDSIMPSQLSKEVERAQGSTHSTHKTDA